MSEPDSHASADRERRRRLDAVFGDVLPGSTSDDRDDTARARPDEEAWYRENRPPHHGTP